MPFIVPLWFNWLATLLVIAFAALKGGLEERVAAGWFALLLAHDLLRPHVYGQLMGEDLSFGLVEVALFGALALRSRRYWMLAMTALSVVALGTTAAQIILRVHGWAYGSAILVWGYLQLGLIAAASWSSSRQSAHVPIRARAAPLP